MEEEKCAHPCCSFVRIFSIFHTHWFPTFVYP
jgi:hypothetical protein